MNNCKGCRYYSEYNDGKFTFPICRKENNLISAADAVKNSEHCKENVTNKILSLNETINEVTAAFNEAANVTKKAATSLEHLAFKAILQRWYNLLCNNGIAPKTKVRKEISKVLTKLEQGEALNEIR